MQVDDRRISIGGFCDTRSYAASVPQNRRSEVSSLLGLMLPQPSGSTVDCRELGKVTEGGLLSEGNLCQIASFIYLCIFNKKCIHNKQIR